MARYDYRCPSCGTQFEVEHPMAEHPEVRCPSCGEVASQVFSASGIVFKGSGFYNTDQRGKGSTGATSATSAPAAGADHGDAPAPSKATGEPSPAASPAPAAKAKE